MNLQKNVFLNFLSTISVILIFSLIPWAEFLSANIKEIDEILNDNFYILIVIYFIFIILIYFVVKFLIKNKSKLYYISLISFSVWIFFQYNLLKVFLHSIFFGHFIWHFTSEISLMLIISLIGLVYFFIEKIKFLRIFAVFFMILNLIYYSAILSPKLNILSVNKKTNINSEGFTNNLNFHKNPNIYLFIVDAMKPLDEFENFYDLNLIDFKKHYKKYDYSYYPNTSNIYKFTDNVLGSFFHLEKTIFQNEDDPEHDFKLKPHISNTFPPLLKKEHTPKLLIELNKFGYDFKWVGNYISNCSKTNFRYCLTNEKKNYIDIYTLQSFFDKSAITQIINKLIKINFIAGLINFKMMHTDSFYEINKYVTSNNDSIVDNKPQFFLIHDLQAHNPYIVDFNCDNKKFEGNYNLEGYKNSYLCNIKKISKMIETLDKFDPSAIVVFQSDHSWIMSQKSESKYGMRTSIFNLIKNGKNCKNLPIPNNLNTLNFGLYILECLKINNK